MSLNAGGIHVRAKARLTIDRVAREIVKYFTSRGARRADRGARALPELGVEETERLGVAVMPASSGWFTILDSEGYSASEGLAEHLARAIATDVVFWEVNGATDSARVERLGAAGRIPIAETDEPGDLETPGGVEDYLAAQSLPNRYIRFGELSTGPTKDRKGVVWLGFSSVDGGAYEGGGGEDEAEDEAPPTVALSDEERTYRDAAQATLERVLAVPHLEPAGHNSAFYAQTKLREDRVLGYPRTDIAELWVQLVVPRWRGYLRTPKEPARAIALIRHHLGWTGAPQIVATSALAETCLALATAQIDLPDHDAARATLRIALRSSPTVDRFSEAIELWKRLGDTEAARDGKKLYDALGKQKPVPKLRAFAEAWAGPVPLEALEDYGLDAHAELARVVGNAELPRAIDAEKARRTGAVAQAIAAGTAAGFDALDFPFSATHTHELRTQAKAMVVTSPAIALAIGKRLVHQAAHDVGLILLAALAGGGDAREYLPLAEILAPRSKELYVALARLACRDRDLDRAIAFCRAAKDCGYHRLDQLLDEADLAPLRSRAEFRALFDERVHLREEGADAIGETIAIAFSWLLPMAKAAPHAAKLFERYLAKFGEHLRFGNTSVNSSERKPLDPAMLGRARSALAAGASKPLVAFGLRDTQYGAYGFSVGALGTQDKKERSVLVMTVPVGTLTGDALADEVCEFAKLAGPYHCGYADIALALDPRGTGSYDADAMMFVHLHPGLGLEPKQERWRLHRESTGIFGARWMVLLGKALAAKHDLRARNGIVRTDAGQGIALRAGDTPERGSLLEDAAWVPARRALARALEPITDFDYGIHDHPEWARRWLEKS